MRADKEQIDQVWQRVSEELEARERKHLVPSDWHALGRAMGVSRQVIGNWKMRKAVPPGQHGAVAEALGWSVDRLLGRDDSAQARPPERGTLEARKTSLSPDEVRAMYATLADPERDLFVRLLVAAGFKLPGQPAEATNQWTDQSSGEPTLIPELRDVPDKRPVRHRK